MARPTPEQQATIRHVWVEHNPAYLTAEAEVTRTREALARFVRQGPQAAAYPSPKAFADEYRRLHALVEKAQAELRRVEATLDAEFARSMDDAAWK